MLLTQFMLLVVLLYRDKAIAHCYRMSRRRFKAVMDVLGAMVHYGVSVARSLELTAQWDWILAVDRLNPVTQDDLGEVQGLS